MPSDTGNSDITPEDDPDQTQPLGHEIPQPDPVEIFKEMMGNQVAATPTPPTKGWEALSPEELDGLMPDYTVVQMLGRGGMGAVYKAIQNSLDRPVAIKVLPGEFCEDIEFEVRFRREAKAMARLNHPNIIQIHDFGQTTGHHFFFVMEFVDGADLLKMIKNGHVDQDSALKVVIQVCEALQYAHDHGYVHRDIKPANILLNSEGVVKVGDFGIAKLIDPELGTETEQNGLTMTGYSMGTPHYVAPEQMSGDQVDHRADIYSLGVMFYEMLTGEIPRGAFDPPSGKIQVDVRIDDVVLKAMHEKPERRYQAAKEVETDVELIRTNPRGQTLAFKEKREAINKEGKSKKGWLAVLVSLLVFGLAAGGVIWKPWENADVDIPESDPIKPAVEEKVNPGLPPVLAQMKKRGGKLKGWTSSGQIDRLNLSLAEGMSDFVSLDGTVTPNAKGFDSEGYRWLARRASGRNIANLSNFEEELETIGRHLAVLKNGQLLRCYNDARSIDQGVSGIIDAETLSLDSNRPLILRRDGSLLLDYFGRGDREAERKKIREIIKPLNDVVKIDQCYESSIILRANGEVISWRGRNLVTPDPPLGRVIDVVAGANFFVSLDDSGTVRTWTDNSDVQYVDVPKDLGKAYGIRAFDTLIAAQMDDGTWRIWGGFDHFGVRKKLNSLGPAVDLLFCGLKNRGEGSILWIEPADQSPPEPVVKIDLPPALAAMKQRGGKLRVWSSPLADKPINSDERAQGISDFVSVSLTTPRWLALRSNGTVKVSDSSQIQKFESLTDVIEIKAGSGYFALRKNGLLVEEISNPGGGEVDHPFPDEIVNFDVCYGTGAFILNSGKVEFRTWENRHLLEIFPKWSEMVNQRTDNVSAALHDGGHGSILRADGTFLKLTPDGNVLETSGVHDVVKLARGAHWLALQQDGTVLSDHWKMPTQPDVTSKLSKAYEVKAGPGISAAQMEDGSWVAWGDNSFGIIDKINSIGPAIDIDFNTQRGHVVWIEPVVDTETHLRLTAPKLELPPALSAMKKRGGRLEHWTTGEWADIDFSSARGIDDFDSIDQASELWLAKRVSGGVASNILKEKQFERADEIVSLSRHHALLKDGQKVWLTDSNPEITPGNGKLIASFGTGLTVILQKDGTLKLLGADNDRNSKQFREDLAPKLSTLTDVRKLLAGGECGATLRITGEVDSWSTKGDLLQPADLPLNIVDISCGYGHVLALDSRGKVYAWGRNYEGQCKIPRDLPRAYAIRGGSYISAIQLEDGSWRAWGDNSLGVVDRINQLGPAVDLGFKSFKGSELQKGVLLWIRPAPGEDNIRQSVPKIELPPALAAMKKRGGRVKTWASPSATKPVPTLSDAEAIQNAVELDNDVFGHWVARLNDGEVITSRDDFAFLNDVTDAIAIRSGGPHMALDASGKLVESLSQSRDISFPDGIQDFDLCIALGVFLLDTGEVAFRTLNPPNSETRRKNEEIASKWSEVINQRSDNVAVAIDDAPSCAVLRSDGTILVGSPSGEIKQRDQGEFHNIVAVDVTGGGAFLALKKDGTVLGLPRSISIPPDLGKAVAVEIESDVCAAQMEDGSWVAWGEGDAVLIRKINSIGPAIDLKFSPETGHLFWIEPAERVEARLKIDLPPPSQR